MSVTAIIIVTVLSLLLGASTYFAFKFAMILLNVEDTLEESLDVLDERYISISRVLEIPVFFDSPEVKSVVKEIRSVRASLHNVAAALEKNANNSIEEEVSDT